MGKKNLFLAILLNIIPGVGLIYAGKAGLGIFFLVAWVISFALFLTGIFAIFGIPLWFVATIGSVIFVFPAVKRHNAGIIV